MVGRTGISSEKRKLVLRVRYSHSYLAEISIENALYTSV